MVFMVKLSGPLCPEWGEPLGAAAAQVLIGIDFWVLLMGLIGASSLVMPPSWTPVPSLGFRGQKGMLTDNKAINLGPLGRANDIYGSLNSPFMIATELQTRA